MAVILDMTNLRDIIDHDVELERQLIENFHVCYRSCVTNLETALNDENIILWRNASHSMKGIAFNLGAEKLGELCLKSEQAHLAPYSEKIILLSEIKLAYAEVETALVKNQSTR